MTVENANQNETHFGGVLMPRAMVSSKERGVLFTEKSGNRRGGEDSGRVDEGTCTLRSLIACTVAAWGRWYDLSITLSRHLALSGCGCVCVAWIGVAVQHRGLIRMPYTRTLWAISF